MLIIIYLRKSMGNARRLAVVWLAASCIGLVWLPARAQEGGGVNTPVDKRAWLEFWDKAANTRYPKDDPNYRAGREIYQGVGLHQRYRYCLAANPDALRVKLNRRTLKPYRGMPVTEFVKALYDCDDAQTQVLKKLSGKDAGLVVYYLHKHYKLRLEQKAQKISTAVAEPTPAAKAAKEAPADSDSGDRPKK